MKSSPLSLWAIYATVLMNSRNRQKNAQNGAVPRNAQADEISVEPMSNLWASPCFSAEKTTPDHSRRIK